MSFQTQVNQQPAPAAVGDFASTNPRHYVLAGPGGLIAGAAGVTVGRFAWVDPGNLQIVANTGAGAPNGFVHREQQALITQYLGEASLVIPTGFPVSLIAGADVWIVNSGTTEAVPGLKAYANNATGLASFAATGSPPTGGTGTASTIAAGTSTSVTASIAVVTDQLGVSKGVMTVSAVGSGAVQIGAVLSGTNVQAGTYVTAQLSGTAGGVGTYQVNTPQTTASTTVTAAYGLLTVGGTVTGTFAVGDTLSGTGVTAGSYITALGTGAGGAGTYIVNLSQTVGSESISTYSATETGWYCRSFGAAGELVKISSQAMG